MHKVAAIESDAGELVSVLAELFADGNGVIDAVQRIVGVDEKGHIVGYSASA